MTNNLSFKLNILLECVEMVQATLFGRTLVSSPYSEYTCGSQQGNVGRKTLLPQNHNRYKIVVVKYTSIWLVRNRQPFVSSR